MKNSILFFFTILVGLAVYAQKAPAKFGKIDIEDLKMTHYAPDSSVEAMVLCNYGFFDSKTLNFTRLYRIKIFKPEGTHWANQAFYSMTRSEVKGRVYNLENDQIVEEKLDNNSVFREKYTDDYYFLRVTLPNVKAGSIIEYEYSFLGLPYEWRFQDIIPVRWSEVIVEPSNYLHFQLRFVGNEPLFIETNSRWVAKDMKPLKEEPFMNSIENYLSKMEFDIEKINAPGYYREYATTWKAVGEFLLNYDYFGKTISASNYLNHIGKTIKANNPGVSDQIKEAFEYVKQVKWNKRRSFLTSVPNLREVLDEKTGNSAEINLMLLQLLREMNIEANPVVINTRENGILSPANPSTNAFNHVIVQVNNGEKEIFLDAANDYNPYDLLPPDCLNWYGCLVKRQASECISVTSVRKDKKLTYYNLQLSDDLVFTGQISNLYSDYAAYNLRKKVDGFSSQKQYFNDFTDQCQGLEISNPVLKNLDSLMLPVEETMDVKIHNHVEKVGNEYYLYPVLYEQVTENPFKLDQRLYPVDFGYKTEKNLIVNIGFPESVRVTEVPENAKVELPEGGGHFVVQYSLAGNQLKVSYKFLINKEVFLPEEYPTIKEFVNQYIKVHSKPVVFEM